MDNNAKMHAMKAIMDYADDAEGNQLSNSAANGLASAPRRESSGGLSDPNFMKKSGSKGAYNESPANVDNGEEKNENGMADDEESESPLKKLMGMFGNG